ncbi:hypothetical protein [Ornithinibacillus halotolerans]|uniref:Uncharacterized protein n=1 Tax=Ornithinibacillus halotolerans TaxID=1274357 RepID=A0A916S101_9BACI|nr:hypothetical protein [Ornithinibacillus halotolerans]GGA79732.1 hypothetical protein GCM10008025_23920 [Ornithinibacillus halotolerans]
METIREEKPNYVLKAIEGVLTPKNPWLSMLKKAIWIIVGLVILLSIIFQENMFSELSWSSQVMLIVLALVLTFTKNSMRVPSPFEIRFYNDYLVVFREKRYYGKLPRKEFNKFYYDEIEKIVHRTTTERISIYGTIEGIWYDYKKDGTLPDKPTYHKTTKGGFCYFDTSTDKEVDFVAEIEKHSPIKVVVENS